MVDWDIQFLLMVWQYTNATIHIMRTMHMYNFQKSIYFELWIVLNRCISTPFPISVHLFLKCLIVRGQGKRIVDKT